MEVYLLLLLNSVLVFVRADRQYVPDNIPLFSDDMNNYINNMGTSWKAGHNFKGVNMDYLQRRMGARSNVYPYTPKQSEVVANLPREFDGRRQWSYCPSVGKVHDQGYCSVCWAFSAGEAISDRICIHSNGSHQVDISVHDIVGCCSDCADSCQDGFPSFAWKFWVKYGAVTGGDYGSNQGCQPYTFAPCGHHGAGQRKQCSDRSSITLPQCEGYCRRGYPISYHQDKHFGEEFYFVDTDERKMRSEIYRNGPVQTEIHLYKDFAHYKGGVYQRHSRTRMGIHAVRLIGWGVENNLPYWLAVNTWGTDWGDNGYFKILRGSNECQIESSITAGIPRPYRR